MQEENLVFSPSAHEVAGRKTPSPDNLSKRRDAKLAACELSSLGVVYAPFEQNIRQVWTGQALSAKNFLINSLNI